MGLKEMMSKAQELSGAVSDTAGRYLDEFKEALPTMRALGFTIRDFRMGMGLIPEVMCKLIASMDTVSVDKIHELITKHSEQKLLITLLKALEAACHVREQLGEVSFKSVEMDLTLGLPPKISVGFA